MSLSSTTAFVLGAGFTRAFVPEAPLLVDHYDIDPLLTKYHAFDLAHRVLTLEKERAEEGKINIERLLTRLEGMPYDREDAHLQLNALKADVHRVFQDRLSEATKEVSNRRIALNYVARHCIKNSITCLTFNYDDVLDEALARAALANPVSNLFGEKYWHPDGGYGFFCQSSTSCIGEASSSSNTATSMSLLKLHGSINWRIKLGFTSPYPLGAVVHHESWGTHKRLESTDQAIESHLSGDRFIVPPVLGKSALKEPILQQIWGKARSTLRDAEEIVFVGYSCPVTDLAASFLFSDTISLKRQRVTVVNNPNNQKAKRQLMDAYQKLFPQMPQSGFQFIDAQEWAQQFKTSSVHGE